MIEVLKQMVEALESATVDCSNFHHAKKDQNHNLGECPPVIRWHHAIEAGKQAIAELESQEPVAWISPKGHIHFDPYLDSVPLYTHPPQEQQSCDKRTWVGLTDEEKADLFEGTAPYYNETDYADAIEAKLKQKNGFAEEKNT